MKYSTIIQNDDEFIYQLCDQFIYEEKIFAIPNVLKMHRHGCIVKKIQDYFVQLEFEEFKFLKPSQVSKIKEDEQSCGKNEARLAKDDLVKEIQMHIRPLDFYKEVAPLVERLINYRLSLM